MTSLLERLEARELDVVFVICRGFTLVINHSLLTSRLDIISFLYIFVLNPVLISNWKTILVLNGFRIDRLNSSTWKCTCLIESSIDTLNNFIHRKKSCFFRSSIIQRYKLGLQDLKASFMSVHNFLHIKFMPVSILIVSLSLLLNKLFQLYLRLL